MTYKWLDILWTDLLGRGHLSRVREDQADDGVPVTVGVVAAGYDAVDPSTEQLIIVPDRATEHPNPFGPEAKLAMGSLLTEDGTPSPLCGRSTLAKVLAHFSEEGYRIQAAAELEFFLLEPSTLQPLWTDINQYSVTKGGEIEVVLGRMRRGLIAAGVPVEAMNPEYSGGQVELNIVHAPANEAADYTVLSRYFAREIARSCGLEATFLAKPWTDQAGNGLHVHQSLWVGNSNVMFENGGLSDLARHYLAGQLAYMRELALLGSSNPNAYHRRSGGAFAPSAISWGVDNRTVAIRVIVGSEVSTRIEQRDASADCNVYLAFAGQFGSGLEGMQRGLSLPAPVIGNAHERVDDEQLPTTFVEAMAAFAGSSFARELLGATAGWYQKVLRFELDEVLGNSADWERARYLSAF